MNISTRAIVAIVVSAILNTVTYIAARYFGFSMMVIPAGSDQLVSLSVAMVLIASIIPIIIAAALYNAMYYRIKNAQKSFEGISILILITSFVGPLTLPVDIGTRLTLVLMHIITAASTIMILTGRVKIIK